MITQTLLKQAFLLSMILQNGACSKAVEPKSEQIRAEVEVEMPSVDTQQHRSAPSLAHDQPGRTVRPDKTEMNARQDQDSAAHSTTSPVQIGIWPRSNKKPSRVKFDLELLINAPLALEWTYSYSVSQKDVGPVGGNSGQSSPSTVDGGSSEQAANHQIDRRITLNGLSDGYYVLNVEVNVQAVREPIGRGATFKNRFYFMREQGKYYSVKNLSEWYAGNASTDAHSQF